MGIGKKKDAPPNFCPHITYMYEYFGEKKNHQDKDKLIKFIFTYWFFCLFFLPALHSIWGLSSSTKD